MTELHDAHSTHYEDTSCQHHPQEYSTKYLRSITLNRNTILYPSRVRVITPCSAAHDAIEAQETGS